LLLASCFDFRDDLAKCRAEGRCETGALLDAGSLDAGILDAGSSSDAGALVCHATGWCWRSAFPRALTVVLAVSDTEVWVGGPQGLLLRLVGGAWVQQAMPAVEITHLARAGDGTVYVGTAEGPVFRVRDGVVKRFDVVGATRDLEVSPGGVAFVAADGKLCSLSEAGCVPVTLPVAFEPWTIAFVGGDLALGGTRGVVVRAPLGSVSFTETQLKSGVEVTDLVFPSATEGWAAAHTTNSLWSLHHFVNGAWREVPAPGLFSDLGLVTSGPGDVLVRDNRQHVVRWNGTTFEPMPGLATDQQDEAVVLSTSPSGEAWGATAGGALSHRENGAWRPLELGSTESWSSVHGQAPDDLWLAGTTGTLLHLWPGGRESRSFGADRLWTVSTTPAEVWVGTSSLVYGGDGGAWRAPVTADAPVVRTSSGGEVWFGGEKLWRFDQSAGASVVHQFDGGARVQSLSLTGGEAFAGSSKGAVLHCPTATNCVSRSGPVAGGETLVLATPTWLFAAVGGQVWRAPRASGAWEPVMTTTGSVRALESDGRDGALVLVGGRTLLHVSGAGSVVGTAELPLPGPLEFHGVFATADGGLVLVGDRGAIITRQGLP
jgi:hypothetical protein